MQKDKQVIFITGIGTDTGKTIASAIVAEAFQAVYWKPVQAGDLLNSDSVKIAALTTNVEVLPERFRLTEPMSPHAAAARDQVEIQLSDFNIPSSEKPLIVEGAGGILVPLNQNGDTFLDLLKLWQIPVLLVSRHYLGSINHTLLTIEALRSAGCKIQGLLFIGDENPETEQIIKSISKIDFTHRIPWSENPDKAFVSAQAQLFFAAWKERQNS